MKPLILCIETAMSACSVALFEGNNQLGYLESCEKNSAAELVNKFIEDILLLANKNFKDLKAIAISGGPGSFTGLRIGSATAKALAYSLQIPLIHLDTPQILAAENNTMHKYVITLIDARRMDVYYAVYDRDLNNILPINFATLNHEVFSDFIASECIFVGDGAEKAHTFYPNIMFNNEIKPLAKNMGKLAMQKYEAQEFEDTIYYEPKYHKAFFTTMKILNQ